MMARGSSRLFALAVTTLGIALTTSVARAGHPPVLTGLEVGSYEPEPWTTRDGMQVSLETGVPLAIYDVSFRVRPGAPGEQALEYMWSENSSRLRVG